jgi:LmbE family N-acetylglucosaminyl deacetylase
MTSYQLLPHYSIESGKLWFLQKEPVQIFLSNQMIDTLKNKKHITQENISISDRKTFYKLIKEGILYKVLDHNFCKPTNQCSLFIQAHFDDAVFSCGGVIAHQYFNLNHSIIIITVFSKSSSQLINSITNLSLDNKQYSNIRKLEENLFLSQIKATGIALDMPEALLRRIKNPIIKSGVFRKDYSLVYAIYEKVASILERYNPICIFFPGAYGWHYDHMLLTLVLNHLINKGYNQGKKLFLYEDYPYCNRSRYDYWKRQDQLKSYFKMVEHYVDISPFIDLKSEWANYYKTQWIDVSYRHLKENIKNFAKSIAIEAAHWHRKGIEFNLSERVWMV